MAIPTMPRHRLQGTEIFLAIPDRKESKQIAGDLLNRQFLSERMSTIRKDHFENPVVIWRCAFRSGGGRALSGPRGSVPGDGRAVRGLGLRVGAGHRERKWRAAHCGGVPPLQRSSHAP